MEKAMYIIWVPDGSCVGPDMQKKGLPHGIRISSRSHLNFNLDDVARGHFSARYFHPLGAPGPRVIYLPT